MHACTDGPTTEHDILSIYLPVHPGPVLTSVMSPDRVVSTDSEGRASCQMTSAGTDGHIKGWRYVEPMKMDDQPMS